MDLHTVVASGPLLQPTAYFQDMYDEPIIAQQESCEDLIRVLRVHVRDDLFQHLLQCRVFTETVCPHINDAVEMSHLVCIKQGIKLNTLFVAVYNLEL
jgi:hypothetical protein